MLPRFVSIQTITPENSYTKTFVLDDAIPTALPGQFIMLWIPGVDEKPFAVVARDPLTITVAAVGPFSRALHALSVGDCVGWRGPFGHGFDLSGTDATLLIGGGYGVAALYFAASELRKQNRKTVVAIGGRSTDDILFAERMQALGAHVEIATEDGSRGAQGFVTDVAWQHLPHVSTILACGPEAMLVAIMRYVNTKNIPAQLSVERYMKCGFGICGQCTLNGKLVCQDGPVFSAKALAEMTEFGRVHRDASGAMHFFQGRGAKRS